jgi:hypothetical protein
MTVTVSAAISPGMLLFLAAAAFLSWLVYRKTAPATTLTPGPSVGERLVFVVTAAAAVTAIGAFVLGGIRMSSPSDSHRPATPAVAVTTGPAGPPVPTSRPPCRRRPPGA